MAKEIAEGADFRRRSRILHLTRSTVDVATSLTDKIDIVQPERL
jgi:hypothetical protein